MKKFSNIQIISFDLDDTLWECASVIQQAEISLYQWLCQHYPLVGEKFTLYDFIEHRDIVKRQYPEIAYNVTSIRKQTLKYTLEQAGYSSEYIVEIAFEYFLHHRHQVTLYPEVIMVLNQLKKKYKMIALTNGNASVYRVGLGEFFSFSVNASHTGSAKPDKSFFEFALQQANIPPEAMLHIGDDPVTDIKGAQNVGCANIWINRKQHPWRRDIPKADAEIKNLKELLNLLP